MRPIKIRLLAKHMCLAKKDGGLGFRDLKSFNLALLAKQGWRLMQCQDSLLFKVYKAKYFQHTSFLEASVPNHSSFAWRSITRGRDLLIQGSRWRVGNGSLINIWTDRWLPLVTNQKVCSPRTILPAEATVADLMDFSAPQPRWKDFLIDSIFFPFEASIIKTIPLSIRRPEDTLIWTKTRSGRFSVRSAYFLELEIEKQSNDSSATTSDHTKIHSFWKGIWSSIIPPKIKSFIWKACNDSLPTRTKLFDRKISNSFSCALCNDEAETNSHLFLECSFAQSVWLQTQFWYGLRLPQPISFIDAMEAALNNLNSADFDTLCIACWMIWNCRNKLIFENKAPSSKDLWARAELYRLEFMEVQQKQTRVAEVQNMKWQPPISDSIHKLNLAISQSKKNTSVGFGFLIRNNKGDVLAASCHRLQKNLNPLCTAAIVMRLAFLFCQNTSFCKVMVECNFEELVNLLNSDRICCLEAACPMCIQELPKLKSSNGSLKAQQQICSAARRMPLFDINEFWDSGAQIEGFGVWISTSEIHVS